LAEELSAPLLNKKARQQRAKAQAGRWHFPLARVAFLAVLVIVGAVAIRVMVVDDPNGGRPEAQVPISSTRDGNPLTATVTDVTPGEPVTITADPEHITPPAVDGPSITTVTDELIAANSIMMLESTGVVADLAEETANGPLPRIASDGRTPFNVYGKPTPADVTIGKVRVAIVVTGLGLNEQGTLDAVDRLPQDVTLAFAPYGRSLERTTGAARAAGHELYLEVPLEPFDYPDNDPGPETLLTGQPARANLEKFYWLLGRFGGYAGVINYMGARFTASAADFAPMMEEVAARGLGYIDDGSSNRSLASQLAETNSVPFSRADLMLDGNPTRAAILVQLAALEEKATANGGAIGIVSALPVSVQTIAEWAEGLEDRGYMLVPASTLMNGT
jgi:polysaccharide deacetylase 2 family uncharacterized protein YibQ